MCMSSPKMTPPPPVPDPPKAPEKADEAVQMARSDEQRRARGMAGSTTKTSPMGITDPAMTTKKTLIGQ